MDINIIGTTGANDYNLQLPLSTTPLSQYLVMGIDNRASCGASSRASCGASSRALCGASSRASSGASNGALSGASCRTFAELRESSVQSSVQKAPQLYAEGWRRGRKRSALVFTERLGGAEVELGSLRRRIPLNVARV